MKYINFNIIKNKYKKIKTKTKCKRARVWEFSHPRQLVPFNFLNEISLRIEKNKRAKVGMGPPPSESTPLTSLVISVASSPLCWVMVKFLILKDDFF